MHETILAMASVPAATACPPEQASRIVIRQKAVKELVDGISELKGAIKQLNAKISHKDYNVFSLVAIQRD